MQGTYFGKAKIGLDLYFGGNWGLGGEGAEGFIFKIGPAFGAKFGESTTFVTGITAVLGLIGDEMYWGLGASPRLYWDWGAFKPVVGLTLDWTHGASKVGFGFVAGLYL